VKASKNTDKLAPELSVEIAAHLARGVREGALIALVALCLYLFLSLATYSPNDPGWSHTGAGLQVANSMGRVGAWCADVLLTLFGYLSYLFPCLVGYKVWTVFRDRNEKKEWHWPLFGLRAAGFVCIIIAGSALAAMHFKAEVGVTTSAGGVLGLWISSGLVAGFSLLGSTLLLLALFFGGITIFTNLSWFTVMDLLGKWTFQLIENSKHHYNRYTEKRAKAKETASIKVARKEAVAAHVKKEEKRKPLNIKPIVQKLKPSVRVEKERQGKLFDAPVTGDLPPISLLDKAEKNKKLGYSEEALEGMSRLLELKLKDFGVDAEVVAVNPGPVITRFEIQPAAGVKVSKISGLAKDLARSLAVISVRVVEVIPGKSVIGIEIPNEDREMVRFSEVVSSEEFDDSASPLTLALGHDIGGFPVVTDLAKMPHLLVAGTTGSGKSVGVNAMILSLLFKSTPEHVRLILIDPKMLELSIYEGIPHLLTPVVTDMKEAANSLRWAVAEMERRYRLMASLGVRNLAGYNRKVNEAIKAGEPLKDPIWKPDESGFEVETEAPDLETLPYIVIVIDEFADMMMIVGKKVEELIARIAQKARAAGLHLILATQRPSVDVITGLIKANVPTRIGFQVSSRVDSRTILDQGGAEQLLGHGDMLYLPPGTGVPIRVHGAFVDDDEVHRVVDNWKKRGQPCYIDEILSGGDGSEAIPGMSLADGDDEQDALYDEAVAFVTETRRASISSVQRKLRIGYNRAARMIETMEAAGVVTEMGTNGSREVLAPPPPK